MKPYGQNGIAEILGVSSGGFSECLKEDSVSLSWWKGGSARILDRLMIVRLL